MKRIVLALAVWLVASSAMAQTSTPTPTSTPTAQTRRATELPGSQAASITGGGDYTVTFSYVTGDSLALVTNDVIQLAKVPKGAVIVGWYLYLPDMDSGSGLTLDFGTTTTPAQFLLDSTLGQAGGVGGPYLGTPVNGLVTNAIPAAVLTADDTIILKATAPAAGAGAGGTIKGWVRYHMHQAGAF